MTTEQVLVLKRRLEKKQQALLEKQAELTALQKRIKKEYNCDTFEQLDEQLEKLEKKQQRQEQKVIKLTEEFKQNYPQLFQDYED